MKKLSCPRCGSLRVWSSGKSWQCAKCDKRWLKHLKRKNPNQKAPEIIQKWCLNCKKYHNISDLIKYEMGNRPRYLCKECQSLIDRGIIDFSLMKSPKKCYMCNKRIFLLKDMKTILVSDADAKRHLNLLGTKRLDFHTDCYESLPKREQRIIEGRNFTHILLDLDSEIWSLLSPEGDIEWNKAYSDIPEIDIKLQKFKKSPKFSVENLLKEFDIKGFRRN